jgi:hypothetical protein
MTDKASKPAFSITPEEFEERIKTLLYTWYRPDIPVSGTPYAQHHGIPIIL